MSYKNWSRKSKITRLAVSLFVACFASQAFASLGSFEDISSSNPMTSHDYNQLVRMAQAVNNDFEPNPQLGVNRRAGAQETLHELRLIIQGVMQPNEASILECDAPACTGE